MLSRTSSQICGRWYLPMFLLRDGLLALIYRASFMVLKRFWSSLPSMVKLSIVTSWPEMLWWSYMGDGALRCSFNLSSKFLTDSSIYSSSQSTLSHLYLYMTPLFYWLGLCSLGTWGGLWLSGHLSGVHQSHIACKCFCSSHWVPGGIGPQCKALDHCFCWTQLGYCCFFSSLDEWMNFSILLYWWPSQDIYISLGIDAGVSLPFAIHQVLNRLFLPCGTGCPPHYIWRI